MNGEIDVFEQMSGVPYDPYDPFSGLTPSAIAGGPAKHFPVEAFAPEPDFLTRMWQPVDYLWESGVEQVEYAAEKLPDLLWETGLREAGLLPKQRVVREGAGVTVVHTQPPYAGGQPASPIQKILPGFQPRTPVAAPPPQAVGTGTMILIGAALIVLYILSR